MFWGLHWAPPCNLTWVFPILRNAGKETEERGGGGCLEQVPFPPSGEDEDSDEDEDAETLPPSTQPQHKKQRVKVSSSPKICGGVPQSWVSIKPGHPQSWGSGVGPKPRCPLDLGRDAP